MKKFFLGWALALAAIGAQAGVVCDSCDYLGSPAVATNLGLHNTILEDNSTFSNSTTGTNGNFSNWWVFSIAPAGQASINAIFLPIRNITNFNVALHSLASLTCAANTATQGGLCSAFGVDTLIADAFTSPAYATVIDFVDLAAGFYAFNVTGTISGLGPNQPASYTGNLQVNAAAVPEPGALALAGLGLLTLGTVTSRRRKAGPEDEDEDEDSDDDKDE